MRAPLGLCLAVAFGAAACLPQPKAGCRTSDDCVGNRVCILATCHTVSSDGGAESATSAARDLGDDQAEAEDAPGPRSGDGADGDLAASPPAEPSQDAAVDSGRETIQDAPDAVAPSPDTAARDASVVAEVRAGCKTSHDCVAPYVCNRNIDNTCGPPRYTHVDVADVTTCAVVSDGTLRCWGAQVGPASNAQYLAPYQVPAQEDVRAVATGWGSTCALLRTGQVDCWGYNANGQLGCASPTTSPNGPHCTPYPAGSPIEQLVAGAERICVRKKDSTVECWGRNDHGDVGDGTKTARFSPAVVSGISDATSIATGVWQACAVLASGSLRCWGANDRAQLGNGTTAATTVPTTVYGMDGRAVAVIAASPAEDHTCALLSSGSVRCFGENLYGELGSGQTSRLSAIPVSSGFQRPAVVVASGIGFTCAVLNDNSVQCLGRGDRGQLGNGEYAQSLVPVTVRLPEGMSIRSLATKYAHICALTTEGRLWCWGANSDGQLGDGTTDDASVPVEVPVPLAM